MCCRGRSNGYPERSPLRRTTSKDLRAFFNQLRIHRWLCLPFPPREPKSSIAPSLKIHSREATVDEVGRVTNGTAPS
jgi:hypothetical protein